MALPAGRYGVTKNQLLKIKKLPMNTIKLIEELTEKFDLLGTAAFKNSTSVVTESSDLVESGAVLDTLRDAEVIEGKNILPFDLKQMASINTGGIWNGNTYTLNNATFTVNKDNIVVNGTPSSNAFFYIYQDLNHTKSWNGLKLTGCPSGGSSSTYALTISNVDITSQTDGGEGAVISIDTTGKVEIRIRIQSGLTVNNLVFKPMISADGGNYQPYYVPLKDALPNKCDNSVIGTVEDGTNPTKSYAVGEHFIRNGKFCTCIVPVTTASTWSDSYYVEGDVASELSLEKITLTPASNDITFDYQSNFKIGKIIVLNFRVHLLGTVSSTDYTIATLDSKYKPSVNGADILSIIGSTWASAELGIVSINKSYGTINLNNAVTGKYYTINTVFICD